jgi:chemotaxis protein histidine kinase CheA
MEAKIMASQAFRKDWDQLLQQLSHTLTGLEQTLAKTAQWQAAAGDQNPGTGGAALLGVQSQKLDGLEQKATQVTQWVEAIDSELRVSEELLRVLLSQTETVRHRLADWAGRAIG